LELRANRPLLAKYPQKAKVVGKSIFFQGFLSAQKKQESQFKAISEH
jgi:hypothetical protein